MAIVPVRLSEDDVRKLNLLMRRGIYRSRNEAIRALVAEGLELKLGDDDDVTPLVNKLLGLRRGGKLLVWFKTRKSAAEIVAEGRE